MTLTKKQMVREIGRRTRLKNRDVQTMLEALIEVWTEELISGGRIDIEHFIIMNVHTTIHAANRLLPKQAYRQINVRVSKSLRQRLNKRI
jgi:nucleoid DNA-binding protein